MLFIIRFNYLLNFLKLQEREYVGTRYLFIDLCPIYGHHVNTTMKCRMTHARGPLIENYVTQILGVNFLVIRVISSRHDAWQISDNINFSLLLKCYVWTSLNPTYGAATLCLVF